MKKANKKKKTHVPFRMNMLFFVVFLLFSALIFRLGIVQIVQGEDYQRKIERTEDVTVNTSVPRGKIYDRYGKVVVDNKPQNAITYTRSSNADPEEMMKTAEKLAQLIEKETDQVTERDKKDFWITKHPKKAEAKITNAEWAAYKEDKLTEDEIYDMQLDRISETDLSELTAAELEVLAIYRAFTAGYAQTPQIVKNENVTDVEYAVVSENLSSLPGVNTTTDWERAYAYDGTLKTVLGNISSSKEGLPREMADYYLARGYSRNDRVGKSYLEYQYEDILRGQKTKMKNVTDKSGNILDSEIITEGQRGDDLVLTIDMDLQTAVEKIIEEELTKAKSSYHPFLDRAFVTMMDPNTGEILAMAGKQYTTSDGKPKIVDFALGNMTTSYAMGSAVKGATILTGYMTGVNEPGERIVDEPLYFGATKNSKSSWFNRNGAMSISDTYALMRSSNVYMFKTAMEIGGTSYVPYGRLKIDFDAFTTMRKYFSQFGLGVKTGIDLPGEQQGYKGIINETEPGKLLDFSIGQFDTYTPLQLAQYVSTIANGGYRMQPHIVKEIREPISSTNKIGPIAEEIEPNVLNTLELEPGWIEQVQEGFRLVVHGSEGTAASYFGDAPYKMAAKTGTAEGVYDGPLKEKNKNQMTWNVTLVGYAPYDNPEVAMAVVVPWAYEDSSSSIPINHYIGRRAMDKYFELKEQRASEKPAQAVIDQDIVPKTGTETSDADESETEESEDE